MLDNKFVFMFSVLASILWLALVLTALYCWFIHRIMNKKTDYQKAVELANKYSYDDRDTPLCDISTAPKDREILLWGVYGHTKLNLICGFVHSKWDADDGDWDTPIGPGEGVFTHWCELPNTTGLPVSIQL